MPYTQDNGFDRVAPFYDSLSRLVFGNALRQAQLQFLSCIPSDARVLLIGGGTGWLLEELMRVRPGANVTYLETSPRMLQLAKERLSQNSWVMDATVFFRLGNEDTLQPDEVFDVILTPFLLDLFREQRLRHLMNRLYAALAPGGHWLFSDFWPVSSPAPLWQRLLLKSMYTFFGLLSGVQATSLPDFGHNFDRLQLQELQSASFYRGMIQAKLFWKPLP